MNDLNYEQIIIEKLEMSNRTTNALRRAGISTLAELLTAYEQDKLHDISHLGKKCYEEIEEVLVKVANGDFQFEEPEKDEISAEYVIPKEFEDIPISDLKLSERLNDALIDGGFDTVAKLLRMTHNDINYIRGVGGIGAKKIKELQTTIKEIKEKGTDYFVVDKATVANVDERYKRTLDIDTVKKLKEEYNFRSIWLREWYGVTRSRIQQILTKNRNRGNWLNRTMTDAEMALLREMVLKKTDFIMTDDGTKVYFLNNRKDDYAVIFVNDIEIKCFFRNRIPEDIQLIIKANRMDCLSIEELRVVSTGKHILILKKEYFCPENTGKFRQLADARGMTTKDYCLFLTGIEYSTSFSTVNDDKIIEFLNAHYVNGRLIIPSNRSTQWFLSFITDHGYTVEDIAVLYGFGETQNIEKEVSRYGTIENDMQPYKIESEDWLDKLYAENPLIGNKVLSEKTKEKLFTIAKEYIDKRLRTPHVRFSKKVKMQITLAVITYAKEWDTGDEIRFWKFITAQFGYRDEANQLRGILCDCVRDAVLSNHRWFISSATGYQYKSTIVLHALTTKRSWFLLCDFLFDFYKTNMEWTYISDDPIVTRMVTALRGKLIAGDETDDDNLEISTKIYYFQEGIRKLIIYRTGYAIKLISHMLYRLDCIINHTEEPAEMYVDVLCDQWIEGKLKEAREDKNREPGTSTSRNVAIDYTRIRPVYSLQNETDVLITLPDIRLKKTEFEKVQLRVYIGDINVETRSLSFYGNELGKTLTGFSINMNTCLRRGDGTLNVRIVLCCDDEEIYDSEDSLFRDCICFSGAKECDFHGCEKGSYSFFTVGEKPLEFVEAEVSDIDVGSPWKSYYVRLGKGFLIKYDNQIVAFDNADDSSSGNSITVIYPSTDTGMTFMKNGRKYNIVTKEPELLLIMDDIDNLRKCAVIMNSQRVEISNIIPESSADRFVFNIPLQFTVDNICEFQVIDFEKTKVLSRDSIKLMPRFLARFNREFYYSDEDFEGAYVNVVDMQGLNRYEINRSDVFITVPHGDGKIDIEIPRVTLRNSKGQAWNKNYLAWIKDVKQNEKIYLTLPTGCSCSMKFGTVEVTEEPKGCLGFGNAVFAHSNEYESEWIELLFSVSKGQFRQEYCIGKISQSERFVGKVRFDYHDNTLFWNRGQDFIGNKDGVFILRIETMEGSTEYPIHLDEEVVVKNPQLELNEYNCSIVKESENIFLGDETVLFEGSLFIGDKNELRFRNGIIEITNITYEEGGDLRSVEIKNTYIDQIKYLGIQFVDSEDRECPVYIGVMFYMGQSLKHHEFSFDENISEKGVQLYKINPVKIIFINEHTLSITNEDDDGIYYYKFYDRFILDYRYAITDREPTARNQNTYYLADLFTYRKKG